VADAVQPQSAAQDAGLLPGDVILAVDGTPISAFNELRDRRGRIRRRAGAADVWRDGARPLTSRWCRAGWTCPCAEGGFETRWLIGLTGGLACSTRRPARPARSNGGTVGAPNLAHRRPAFRAVAHDHGRDFVSCNLRGPIGIAETSGAAAAQGTASFIWFIAMLSTAVGLMNLFPVPVLDGGHLVFHAWEAVTGKPPSDRALRVLMTMGLMILSLMVFAMNADGAKVAPHWCHGQPATSCGG
jgi:regulator of sigma E protease